MIFGGRGERGERKGQKEREGEKKGPVEGHTHMCLYHLHIYPGAYSFAYALDICIFAAKTITITRQRERRKEEGFFFLRLAAY